MTGANSYHRLARVGAFALAIVASGLLAGCGAIDRALPAGDYQPP